MENLGFVPTAIDAPERWGLLDAMGVTVLLGPLAPLAEFNPELLQNQRAMAADTPKGQTPARETAPSEPTQRKTVNPEQSLPQPTGVQDPLPGHWQSALSKAVFGRPVLWTYPELGQDLFAEPSPERRQALRQLLGQLNMGSVHNFWPFREPGKVGESMDRLDMFTTGLLRLSPKCLIYLGADVSGLVTGVAEAPPFSVSFSDKLMVMCLFIPELAELSAQPQLLSKAVSFLQTKLPAYIGG